METQLPQGALRLARGEQRRILQKERVFAVEPFLA